MFPGFCRGICITKEMTNEILKRFFKDQCTSSELEEVIKWARNEAFEEEYKNKAFEDWKHYQNENDLVAEEQLSLIFDKIRYAIEKDKSDVGYSRKNPSTLLVFAKWLTRIAAVLLLPVLVFIFFSKQEKKSNIADNEALSVDSIEVIAPIGSRTVIQLSDGSTVHLNYGSKIKYPQYFRGNTREIRLMGEGYFEVAHQPEKPFVVKTARLNVRALGTKFNVSAYYDDDFVETTLAEGKVVLEETNQDGESDIIETMAPGQHINYNIDNKTLLSSHGNIEKYISWKDGKTVFEDTPITVIAEKLNRMFNVDIEVNENIRDYIFTVTFVDEPLFQILDLVTIAAPITYKVLPRRKLPDGTYLKQKIIIEKK